MEAEIKDILSTQSRVHSLLSAVSSRPANGSPEAAVWVSAADSGLQRVQVADLSNESTTIDSMQSLLKLAKEYDVSDKLKVLSKARRFRSSMVQLTPIAYPKQVKLCPSVEDIKKNMTSGMFALSVFSYAGYSFQAEYTHVYKAKFNQDSAMNDHLIILQRALRASSPSISDKRSTRYAEFILRMASWEANLSASVLEGTIRGIFPSWPAYPLEEPAGTCPQHAEVHVGHNSQGELSFTVRLRKDLVMYAASTVELSTKAATAAAVTSAETLPADVALEVVYYREFVLNDTVIDTFGQASYVSNIAVGSSKGAQQFVPPPPPPKRNNKGTAPGTPGSSSAESDDVRVFLLVTHKLSSAGRVEDAAPAAAVSVSGEEDATTVADSGAAEEENASEAWVDKSSQQDKNVSFCAELYGWGLDAHRSLGLGDNTGARARSSGGDNTNPEGEESEQDMVHGPRKISLDRVISMERVRSLACSANHTLLLTCMGSVFACGENSEGALGTGDIIARSTMTLVDWPVVASGEGIIKIAAGSSSIGSHSMAIDRAGNLYGWGVAYAVGVGQIKAITTPSLVPVGTLRDPLYAEHARRGNARGVEVPEPQGEIEDDIEFVEDPAEAGGQATQASRFTAEERREVVDVACGGGFTVCVTRAGHVFSWGVWAHGRLGLGPVPIIDKLRGPYRGTGKKIARYQLHPRRIHGVEGAVQVSCGEAHSLCLLRNGCVLAWGQNSCGQLGNGPTSLGMLSDAYRPVLIPHFGHIGPQHSRDYNVGRFAMRNGNEAYQAKLDVLLSSPSGSTAQGRSVTCGAFHSVCVDERGVVFTWGARGSPCIGHNDAPIVGDWNRRINAIFSISATDNKTMVPHELYHWCMAWSMPRVVQALAGGPLQSSAGAFGDEQSIGGGSTAGQSASSEVHVSVKQRIVQVCAGDLSTAFLTSDGKLFVCGTGPAVPNFTPASRTLQDIDLRDDGVDPEDEPDEADLQHLATVVASPRCPSDSWLRELCTRKVSNIAGCGNRIFVVVDEEVVSHCLTAPLLRTLLDGKDDRPVRGTSSSTTGGHSVSESDAESNWGSVFEQRGKADCMVLASGKVFLCHKALLAQRSPELRDMIVMESPTDDSTGQLVQILLPELQRDAARALMHYLYRDVLPAWCIGSTSLLTSLARTGKTLRMPRLQILADRFLQLLRSSEPSLYRPSAAMDLELPPPTLARDLSALVGDPEFADVRFIAEGRAIVAHRFILESRCAYFRAMFRSGMAESGGRSGDYSSAHHEMVDVVVPDTFVGFLRLLIFLYTGSLPDGSDGALLEDLMAADRYVIPDMKLLCENMLVPSESNWLDLLRAAQLLNSLRLELQVMAFLKTNFSVLKGLYLTAEETATARGAGAGAGGGAGGGAGAGTDTAEEEEEEEEGVQVASVADFQEEFPGLLEDLLASRKVIFPLPPSQLIIQQSADSNEVAANARSKDKVPVFPIWALGVAAVSMFLYQHMSKIISLGPLIPVINFTAFLAIAAMAIKFFAK